jgi:hypothetical protein
VLRHSPEWSGPRESNPVCPRPERGGFPSSSNPVAPVEPVEKAGIEPARQRLQGATAAIAVIPESGPP